MTNTMLWGLLLLMEVLPVGFLAVGRILLRHPPRLGKGFLSFRSGAAQKDEAHWQFAQKYYGRRLTTTMPILMIAAAMTCMVLQRASASSSAASMAALIALFVEFISVIVCQGVTTHSLEKRFHDLRGAAKDDADE